MSARHTTLRPKSDLFGVPLAVAQVKGVTTWGHSSLFLLWRSHVRDLRARLMMWATETPSIWAKISAVSHMGSGRMNASGHGARHDLNVARSHHQ